MHTLVHTHICIFTYICVSIGVHRIHISVCLSLYIYIHILSRMSWAATAGRGITGCRYRLRLQSASTLSTPKIKNNDEQEKLDVPFFKPLTSTANCLGCPQKQFIISTLKGTTVEPLGSLTPRLVCKSLSRRVQIYNKFQAPGFNSHIMC